MDHFLRGWRIWIPIVALFLTGMVIGWIYPFDPYAPADNPGFGTGYLWRWFGAMAKTASGGFLGFWFSRDVVKLDVSEIIGGRIQAEAAKSQAFLIGLFALGVAWAS